MARHKLTIAVEGAGTADVWRRAAADLGYITTAGSMTGQGSISAVMSAIALGELEPAELAAALERVVNVSEATD